MSQVKQRDKSKKRTAIIDGAIDVFIDMGYENASMDKIAETAGVSKRTVYNHFGSKENLFQIIIEDFLEQRQHLKTIEYDSEQPLSKQLKKFAESEIFLIDSPRRLGLSRFLTITFLNDLEYQRKTVSKYPSMYDMLLEWLSKAQEDGKITEGNSFMMARVFYALVTGGITWPALFTYGIDKKAAEPMIHEIVNVFLAKYEKN